MKKIVYIILFAFAMASCKPSEIQKFGEDRFIYFNPVEDDGFEYNYSFLYAGDKTEIPVVIPLKYAGRPYTSDMEYRVVAGKGSTAIEGINFKFPEQPLFKGASYTDELVVTIFKPDNDTDEFKLVLELTTNENFQSRMKGASIYTINFSNMISRPSWWNAEVEQYYLGEYSDKKFELFVKNIIHDQDYGEMDSIAKRAYALQFKRWLKEHPDQAVEDGREIVVPV